MAFLGPVTCTKCDKEVIEIDIPCLNCNKVTPRKLLRAFEDWFTFKKGDVKVTKTSLTITFRFDGK